MSILLSFLLGLKHASDADHLAAMMLLVDQHGKPRQAFRLGALWGLGHGLTVVVFGCLLIYSAQAWITVSLTELEPVVGVVLMLTGIWWALKLAYPNIRLRKSSKTTGNDSYAFQFGLLHGLAGSAAVTLLVLSEQSLSSSANIVDALKLGIFAVGCALAMALFCLVYSLNINLIKRRLSSFMWVIQLACSMFAVAIGLKLIFS